MQFLSMPTDSARTAFSACISNYQDDDLKKRLKSISDQIVRAEDEYKRAGNEKTLHTIRPEKGIGTVTAEEMTGLYDNKFVPKKAPGRKYYDKLRAGTRGGKCPLCGHRNASALDHHLAKTVYSAFAVTPCNLIPVCSECNFIKRNERPQDDRRQTLHPYFDNVETDTWLVASVAQTTPVSVTFETAPPAEWEEKMKGRVEYHFTFFKLGDLYTIEAANELAGIEYRMGGLRKAGGAESVHSHLLDAWNTWRQHKVNCWQTALYKALSDSAWYCENVGAVL